jgi:D-beta-D-heptose 7-phosphate kinase/D-beta-D-heptose 1-phosphate adenosyltransferase
MLAALEGVDLVVVFTEDTPLELIRAIQPNVLVKGGDYARDMIVGSDLVEAAGGTVVVVDLFAGYSTTSIISRLLELRNSAL